MIQGGSKIRSSSLWWRRGESNSCPKTTPRNFLRAYSVFKFSVHQHTL